MAEDQKKCHTCGKSVAGSGHLCVPTTQHDTKCDWCQALIPDARHLCCEKVKDLAYICNSCGRVAVSPEYLCRPEKIS